MTLEKFMNIKCTGLMTKMLLFQSITKLLDSWNKEFSAA